MKCEEKKLPTKQFNSESSDAQAIPTEKGFMPRGPDISSLQDSVCHKHLTACAELY